MTATLTPEIRQEMVNYLRSFLEVADDDQETVDVLSEAITSLSEGKEPNRVLLKSIFEQDYKSASLSSRHTRSHVIDHIDEANRVNMGMLIRFIEAVS